MHKSLYIFVVALCVLLGPGSSSRPTAQTPSMSGFVDSIVLSGLSSPTAVRFAPDGRIFVAEKSGLIKVFESLTDTTASIVADLRTNVHNYWDRGMLGLAIDPGYPSRPYLYVSYTFDGPIGGSAPRWGVPGETSDGCPSPPGGTADGCEVSGRISRLQLAGSVMTGTERVLVHDWFQQFPGHSMAGLAFGSDGALYGGGGDGASWQFADYGQRGNPGGDPPVGVGGVQTPPTAEGGALRAQDIRTTGDPTGLNGAIFRIDPTTGAALANNPLASNPDPNARRLIAYGLRNPFRMTFRPGTRELWVGEVGWKDWEEINLIPDVLAAPLNFGWPCYEGRLKQPGYDAANLNLCESLYAQPGAVTFARYEYKEGAAVIAGEGCANADSSTSGLAFYQSGSYPAKFRGALFFADYTRRCIWVMYPGADGRPNPATRAAFVANAANPVDLQTGPDGDLFYVDNIGGTIRRIRYSAGNSAPRAVATATPASGPAPLTVSFDARGSTDAEDSALNYDWDLNGDGVFGDSTAATPSYTYSTNGNRTVTLKVTDSGSLSDTDTVVVSVGNTSPTAIIDTPAATLKWRVGQAISFTGRATDPQQGTLPASALAWSLIMNHCSTATSCHEHAIQSYAGVAGGSFVAPDHDYPSYLTLRLTATDSGGLQHTVARRLDPQTVVFSLQSSPSGAQLGFGSDTVTTPTTRTMIVGSTTSISAPSPQALGGAPHVFASWSDGGGQTHNVTAGTAAATFTATYRADTASGPGDVVLHAGRAPVRAGTWRPVPDTTAAGGLRMEHPDAGLAKPDTALAAPRDYFEMTFSAEAGRPYRLWVRGRAQQNSYNNDSVYVQFSGSVNSAGTAVNRIGTTSGASVIIEDCRGCGVAGWGWQDIVYDSPSLGAPIYFASSGAQTIRIQGREDGISIDQIVLSPSTYFDRSPGLTKNDTTILPATAAGAAATVVRYAALATVRQGTWRVVSDPTAADGSRLEHPDGGAPKLSTPLATPANYFELPFDAEAGVPYRVWLRGRALNNSYNNDSVHLQFSGSVDRAGTPQYRIGTTASTVVVLEECGGCGLADWAWEDNGYGKDVLGPPIYFATTGPQIIRIQGREDGISIDQVVISRSTYLTESPGAIRNDAKILPRTP